MTDDEVIDVVLKFEGGFTNDPADHGGPTNFGITAAEYGRWKGFNRNATAQEVQAMTVVEARAIYKEWYITKPGFDVIQSGKLRLILIDCGVLHGTGRAARWLQQSLGVVADGVIGPKTRDTLSGLAVNDQDLLAKKVLGYRFQSFADIVVKDNTQLRFLRGWVSRAVTLLDYV
jgi:lysozyme family protein